MTDYLRTVEQVYADAATRPDTSLCCTAARPLNLPGLHVPPMMYEMNYGCGSIVDPFDVVEGDTVLYVGVGGGLEALQFAYFTRCPDGVLAIDPVPTMRAKAQQNLDEAARLNDWFRPEYVRLLDGSALALPLPSNCVTIAAQNCLFNIFTDDDLRRALAEVFRVLKPGGFFATSDPVAPAPLPAAFRADTVARARCLSGCPTFDEYLVALTDAGFGHVEVRARFPYRLVTPMEFPTLSEAVLLESVEVVAFKVPAGPDGPRIDTGRTAIYRGPDESWSDEISGAVLPRGIPVPISDAAARRLADDPAVLITPPTYHARGGDCC